MAPPTLPPTMAQVLPLDDEPEDDEIAEVEALGLDEVPLEDAEEMVLTDVDVRVKTSAEAEKRWTAEGGKVSLSLAAAKP